MRIGYARVSTKDQVLDRQIIELKAANIDKLFQDKASGKDTNRTQFNEMVHFAREGDTIVVSSLDRLGRNYEDIKEMLELFNQKEINVEILDAPFLKFNTGNKTLDKALFDMLTSMLSYIAENERAKMLERQKAGIEIAKTKGVYKGKSNEYSAESKNPQKRAIYFSIVKQLEDQLPIKRIAENHGVTRKLIYRIQEDINKNKKRDEVTK